MTMSTSARTHNHASTTPTQTPATPRSAPRSGPTSETGSPRDPSRRAAGQRSVEVFARLRQLSPGSPEHDTLRDEIINEHAGLAHYLAQRYAGRGESLEDLTQVALLGLVKAVDRFDPGRGAAFTTFATPTIVGEVKRHFRDTTWSVHVPRRMQELSLAVTRSASLLSAQLGRPATLEELAAHLDVLPSQVREAFEAGRAYTARTLDAPTRPGAGRGDGVGTSDVSLGETLGQEDLDLEAVVDREVLRPLLAEIPERERTILALRFGRGLSQAQIGQRVGLSQMHVSRLLAATLSQLREGLHEDDLAA